MIEFLFFLIVRVSKDFPNFSTKKAKISFHLYLNILKHVKILTQLKLCQPKICFFMSWIPSSEGRVQAEWTLVCSKKAI